MENEYSLKEFLLYVNCIFFPTMALTPDEAMELGLIPNPEENKKPRKLCRGLRYDLKKCLLATDCCKIVSTGKILKYSC